LFTIVVAKFTKIYVSDHTLGKRHFNMLAELNKLEKVAIIAMYRDLRPPDAIAFLT